MSRQKEISDRVHIRRCHVCSNVTEAEGRSVKQCKHCGKALAPFYFFNEIEVQEFTDFDLRPHPAPKQRSPVRGFTAIW